MTDGIRKIDYSLWDTQTKAIARRVDTDDNNGLNGIEIFNFARTALKSNVQADKISELLGFSAAKTRGSDESANSRAKTSEFDAAIKYFNSLSYWDRGDIIDESDKNLTNRLYNMESGVRKALADCEAYNNIIVMARWHYRYYPYHYTPVRNDPFMNFDIEEIRTKTTKDMKSLDELKYNIECAIEEAKGNEKPKNNFKSDYDVDKMALKHLGMSYKDFAKKYKDEIEFCKQVTYADYASMTPTQRDVYGKLRNYAIEMLDTTIVTAQMANIDANNRISEETLKATNDMITLMDFQYDGITDSGLNRLESDITYKALEEALIKSYRKTDIDSPQADNNENKRKKVIGKNGVEIRDNGKKYNLAGHQVK